MDLRQLTNTQLLRIIESAKSFQARTEGDLHRAWVGTEARANAELARRAR
jgi:hypothetical protein